MKDIFVRYRSSGVILVIKWLRCVRAILGSSEWCKKSRCILT